MTRRGPKSFLTPEGAAFVRDEMERLLHDRFAGNKSSMATAMRVSRSYVADALSGRHHAGPMAVQALSRLTGRDYDAYKQTTDDASLLREHAIFLARRREDQRRYRIPVKAARAAKALAKKEYAEKIRSELLEIFKTRFGGRTGIMAKYMDVHHDYLGGVIRGIRPPGPAMQRSLARMRSEFAAYEAISAGALPVSDSASAEAAEPNELDPPRSARVPPRSGALTELADAIKELLRHMPRCEDCRADRSEAQSTIATLETPRGKKLCDYHADSPADAFDNHSDARLSDAGRAIQRARTVMAIYTPKDGR